MNIAPKRTIIRYIYKRIFLLISSDVYVKSLSFIGLLFAYNYFYKCIIYNSMDNKIIFPFLLLIGISSCSINQVVSDIGVPSSVKWYAVKTVKDYINSGEFIEVTQITDSNKASSYSFQKKQEEDYKMKEAAYRFYKHCTQDKDGIITCNVANGKDINISEEIFELRIRDMESCNEWIRKCKREGKYYKITRLDDKYFNELLNYK